MKKFTVFTIMLLLIVSVVFSEVFTKEYLPAIKAKIFGATETGSEDDLKTNVLDIGAVGENKLVADDMEAQKTATSDGSEELGSLPLMSGSFENIDPVKLEEEADAGAASDESDSKDILTDLFGDEAGEETVDVTDNTDSIVSTVTGDVKDFENENFVSTNTSVYLTDEQIKSAGFENAYLEKEAFDDLFFKSMDVSDLEDVEVTKTVIRTQESLLAKVYVFKAGIKTNINEVYQILRMRAGDDIGVEVNETNDFGIASFYMNDSKRSGTAFLTVRVGGLIYGFSYPKEYHSQIKNLIQLIEWELG